MKKKIFALVITLVMIIGIGGCRGKETPEGSSTSEQASVESDALVSPEPTNTESEMPSSPASAKQDEATSVKVHIDLATDELLDQYSSVYEYINDEDGASVIIWTDTTIKDFAL